MPSLNGFAFTVSLAVLLVDGRLAHAAAGAARLRRPQHRAPARAVREQERARLRHLALVPLEPVRPAPALGRRRSAGWPSCSPWPRRSSACASGSPTPGTTRRPYTTRQAYDLLADGFGPGFTAPLVLAVQGATGDDLLSRRRRGRRRSSPRSTAWPRSRRPIVNEAGDTAVRHAGRRPPRPRTQATEDLVDTLRDDAVPDGHRGHRPHRRRRRASTAANLDITRGVGRPAAAVLRRRAAGVVPAADDGVPLRRRAAQGGGHEPAVDRRRLRRARPGRPVAGCWADLVGIPEETRCRSLLPDR